ncbi:cell division protein ZipA [Candidatus Berkiella aquae]|uniref:Cell division protein ZipA n=1 Tax=Candidatus Berkiella aquae TaxID=295108 RepID=A0A0Q9YIM7_9GAMM|nr:cell division protein ZipA [Candidatus Berkiella aquae]MCS5711751.1 cell division protein ZipA [Candidatus Berkiella aquae]
MQTDLQLLLLIIGLVFGGFILYNTFRKKANTKAALQEEFESITTKQATQYKERHDPLLDDYDEEPAGKKVLQEARHEEWVDSEAAESELPDLFATEPETVLPELIEALPVLESEDLPAKEKSPEPPAIKPEIIILSIMPHQGNRFTGAMLLSALKANQFYYGEHKIFHRHVNDNPKEAILFSVASLIEPGNFEYHQMLNKNFPGILMWMMLPGPMDAMQSFDKMLRSARQLASFLGGDLCDAKRLALTTEVIATMRERVHQFQVMHENHLEYELE